MNKEGVVRRARIYYIRKAKGKKARIEEKQYNSAEETADTTASTKEAVAEKV